jgi:hypothetical protein
MYKAAMKRSLPFDEPHRKDVAAKFAQFGWQFSAVPICPHCVKQQANTGGT